MNKQRIEEAIDEFQRAAIAYAQAKEFSEDEKVKADEMHSCRQTLIEIMLDECEPDPTVLSELDVVKLRKKFAPGILASLLRQPFTNDAATVARAVSLSDALARAITAQPVA